MSIGKGTSELGEIVLLIDGQTETADILEFAGILAQSSGGKDVGHFLLSQASACGADLVVMGVYGRTQLRERIFGGVTRTVLYEADLPVLMSR